MYMLNPDVAGDGEGGGGNLRNLSFQLGNMDEDGVAFEFDVDSVMVVIGESGKVLGIKLLGVEEEIVEEMGLGG